MGERRQGAVGIEGIRPAVNSAVHSGVCSAVNSAVDSAADPAWAERNVEGPAVDDAESGRARSSHRESPAPDRGPAVASQVSHAVAVVECITGFGSWATRRP